MKRIPKKQVNPPNMQNNKNRKPPKIDVPRYDLLRNIPAPDSMWNEYSPIKNAPTPFSPQSPRFVEFYKEMGKKPVSKPDLEAEEEKNEEFVLEEENEPIKENIKVTEDKEAEEKIIKTEEEKETEETKEIRTILFIPKEIDAVPLHYRPFGRFGENTFRKPKKSAVIVKETEN